jgi:amino-acid N-acetyltransferase
MSSHVAFLPSPTRPAVERLLAAASLPIEDLEALDLADFLAAGSPDAPAGVVGLEIGSGVALLRSLVVDPGARGTGLGQGLVAAAEAHARRRGVRTIYLLTTTAEGFFARLGYRGASRESAPEAIRQSREFAALCPASAAFMSKEVG